MMVKNGSILCFCFENTTRKFIVLLLFCHLYHCIYIVMSTGVLLGLSLYGFVAMFLVPAVTVGETEGATWIPPPSWFLPFLLPITL